MSEVFLLVRLELWALEGTLTEVQCHCHHVTLSRRFSTADVDLDHLAEVKSVHNKVPLSHPLEYVGRTSPCAARAWRPYILLHISEGRGSAYIVGILLYGRFVSSPHWFAYSIIYLSPQYGLMGMCFVFWVIIQYHIIYFVAQTVQLCPLRALSSAPVSL